MKFTDRGIRALNPTEMRYEVFADQSKGFGIRVSPSGLKTWLTMYRLKGKLVRICLGNYPAMSLQQALERHHEHRKLLNHGIDPRAKLREEREVRAAQGTVSALANEYLERHARPNKLTWQEDDRMISKDILPRWGDRLARDIRRRDVVELLDAIGDRGSRIAANRTRTVLSKLFNFAVERDLLDASPVTAVKRPYQEKPRRRTLSDSEIRSFWSGLPETKIPLPQQLALKILLLTGQRRGELTKSRVTHFDLDAAIWTIPPELINKKKSRDVAPHEVPLSSLAVELVRELLTINGGSIWMLPSPRKDTHVSEGFLTRTLGRNRNQFDIDEPFNVHDLRRTLATRLGELGIPHHIMQRVLNHEPPDITARVYDQHHYLPEKRQALDAWTYRLEEILHG